MRLWAVLAVAPLAGGVSACSSIKDFIATPTAFGAFTVAKDSGAVFKSVQAYALRCYQERDYDHKTTIEARFSDDRKTGEVSVVMRGIDATKYTMHISLDALGPNETEVKVRDLSVSEAERRLDGVKAAARGGAAVCT
jgi:hypothetical protein